MEDKKLFSIFGRKRVQDFLKNQGFDDIAGDLK
jgi:hypothetical protein